MGSATGSARSSASTTPIGGLLVGTLMQLTDARAGLVLGGVTAVAVALAVLPVVRRLDAVEPEPAGSMV